MGIGAGEYSQSVAIVNLVTVKTNVANARDRVLRKMAAQSQVRSPIEVIPDGYRELCQVHFIPHHHIFLAGPFIDNDRFKGIAGTLVPGGYELVGFDPYG